MGSIIIWTIIAFAALAADIMTSSFFLSGFTIGGIGALIGQICDFSLTGQIIIFVVVSSLAIAIEYMWLRVKLEKSIPRTLRMEEEYLGRKIIADEDINMRGRIKIDGIYWTAENQGELVKKGDNIAVIGIKGNKILIKKESNV